VKIFATLLVRLHKGRSVADMITGSMKKYGKKLCSKCCLEMKRAEAAEKEKETKVINE